MEYYLRFFVALFPCFNLVFAQQYYDIQCDSVQSNPGSKYTCNEPQSPCQTFLVYRANKRFDTVPKISRLFGASSSALLRLNSLTVASELLGPGREILVPVLCACSDGFFSVELLYTTSGPTSLVHVACWLFEGLVTVNTLAEANEPAGNLTLHVPLKCACPDDILRRRGFKYLVTFPFVEGDDPVVVSEKFNVSPQDLWDVNRLENDPTVYPATTVLVPLRTEPVINRNFPDSPPPVAVFLPTTSVRKLEKANMLIVGGVIVISVLIAAVIGLGTLYVKGLKKWKGNSSYKPFTAACLSPDLLAGIEVSLACYTVGEITRATRDFSDENKLIGPDQLYAGIMEDGRRAMIKKMEYREARRVIDVHSRINHVNVVKLLGVCHVEGFHSSYLVFEHLENGCLREQLSELDWPKRARIAFDVATGLNYLHCCIFPSYAHGSIGSESIFLTADSQAKLGPVAPGAASERDDVSALGTFLLELISGRKEPDPRALRFLGGGAGEGECFERLRRFVDARLKDYSLAEAWCLAVLGKACSEEDDDTKRPSMHDVIKVISMMVQSHA